MGFIVARAQANTFRQTGGDGGDGGDEFEFAFAVSAVLFVHITASIPSRHSACCLLRFDRVYIPAGMPDTRPSSHSPRKVDLGQDLPRMLALYLAPPCTACCHESSGPMCGSLWQVRAARTAESPKPPMAVGPPKHGEPSFGF